MAKGRVGLGCGLAFIFGIFLSSFFMVSQLVILGFLIGAVFLITVFWQYKRLVVYGLFILFFILGIYRHQQALGRLANLTLGEVDVVVKVVREPEVRVNSLGLTVKIPDRAGKILVTLARYPEYYYADELRLKGEVQLPMVFEDFNYKDYLLKEGVYGVMYYPQVELLQSKSYGGWFNLGYAKLLDFKGKVRKVIRQVMAPPQGAVLAAMILGDKRQMSDSLKDKLGVTGLRHITAVSGLHITILSSILMTLLLRLGVKRSAVFYMVSGLIVLFIFMTGLQASAIRAGLMGGLLLLSQQVGRLGSSKRTVFFVLGVMLWFNPLLLKLDVGFQLSFLAVLGIIYLGPIFRRKLRLDILATTLAAQVFTLPILVYNFGYVSWVAPLANILVVPFMSFIMLLGLLFILGGLLFLPLGLVLSFPAWLLLTYLLKVVDWFSVLPVLTFALAGYGLGIAYLLLGVVTFYLLRREKLKHLCY